MKTLILIFCLLPMTALAAPTAAPAPVKLTRDDVLKTIEHIQKLAKDAEARADQTEAHAAAAEAGLAAAVETNSSMAATVTKQATSLAASSSTNKSLVKNITGLEGDLSAEKSGRWTDRLVTFFLGYPITLVIGVVVGMLLLPCIKFGLRAGLKAVTGL